jgi:hydrogenase nickel incorporation protein HypA/HybF
MSAAYALLRIVEEHARANAIGRVSKVRVRIGVLRALETRQFAAAFEAVAEGGIAEGATLQIDAVSAKARCNACAAEWRLAGFRFDCPQCGGVDAEILEGQEFYIESFDGERGD